MCVPPGLSAHELGEVWRGADADGDGALREEEFVAAMELAEQSRKARHDAAARRALEGERGATPVALGRQPRAALAAESRGARRGAHGARARTDVAVWN